jgi:hypothetical protein
MPDVQVAGLMIKAFMSESVCFFCFISPPFCFQDIGLARLVHIDVDRFAARCTALLLKGDFSLGIDTLVDTAGMGWRCHGNHNGYHSEYPHLYHPDCREFIAWGTYDKYDGSTTPLKCFRIRSCFDPTTLMSALSALSLLFVLALMTPEAQARPGDRLVDFVANKLVKRFQNASCAELETNRAKIKERMESVDPQTKQKVKQILQRFPEQRRRFINRVAAPNANRMFDCGLIP